MKKNVFAAVRHAWLFFGCLIVWGVLLFWQKPADTLKYFVVERQSTQETETLAVYGDEKVTQTFLPQIQWDALEIQIGSHDGGSHSGQFVVRLYDAGGSCMKEWTKDQLHVDGGWMEFPIGQTIMPNGQACTIEVTAPELDERDSIQLTIVKDKLYQDGSMACSAQTGSGTLAFSVYKSYPNLFAYAALAVFGITVLIWWKLRRRPVEAAAPVILIGMGLCMLLIMAPAAAPDDGYHYTSSLVLSNAVMGHADIGKLDPEYMDFTGIPTNINANSAFVRALQDAVHAEERMNGITYIDCGSNVVDRLYHPVEYLVPALAVTAGRLLGFHYIYIHYLGRLFQLIFYVGMALTAVKIIPENKEMMLLVTALPMCLHQAVSFSYDVVLNGMSFVFLAYVIKAVYERKQITWREILVFTVTGCIFVPVKLVYIVLLLAVFMIPKECFEGKADRMIKIGTMYAGVLAVAAAAQWPLFFRLLRGGQATADTTYTAGFILDHPADFLQMLVRTLVNDSNRWVRNLIGARLAGQNLAISDFLITGFLALLLLCAFHKKEEEQRLHRIQKWNLAAVCMLGTLGICFGALTWTKYGSAVIQGIQGRYFIPYLLPALLCLNWNGIQISFDKKNVFYAYWFLQMGVIFDVVSQVVY